MTHITKKVKRQLSQSLFLKSAGTFWGIDLTGLAMGTSLGFFFMTFQPIDTGAPWICMRCAIDGLMGGVESAKSRVRVWYANAGTVTIVNEDMKQLSPQGDKPPLPASEAHVRRLI